MQARPYWAVASGMVLGLLGVSWGLTILIEAETWPFHLLWGGFFVLMGGLLLTVARMSPASIRSLPGGDPTRPLPPPPPREARAALDSLAAGLVASGLAYALTARLAALAVAFTGVMLLGRLLTIRRHPAA